jgi:hypothetical protein
MICCDWPWLQVPHCESSLAAHLLALRGKTQGQQQQQQQQQEEECQGQWRLWNSGSLSVLAALVPVLLRQCCCHSCPGAACLQSAC